MCCCICLVAGAGELLKKGPGQYKVPGVTLTQQQPSASQGPADSAALPSHHPAAGGISSQRKRPRQTSSQQQQQSRSQGQGHRQYSQYQQQQQAAMQFDEDAGSDDGYDDGY